LQQCEDAERRLVVQMNVRGRDIGGFVAEARHHVTEAVTLPAGLVGGIAAPAGVLRTDHPLERRAS
jgi:hypothetical protein